MNVPERKGPLDIPTPAVPTASDTVRWRRRYFDSLDRLDGERQRGDHWHRMACFLGSIMGVEFGVIVLLAVILTRM